MIDAGIELTHTETVSEEEKDPTISKVTDRLAARFPAAPRQRIERIVTEEYASLAAGRIRNYIPTLVENSARTRLHREIRQDAAGGGQL